MKNNTFAVMAKLAFFLCLLMPGTAGATGYTLTVSAHGSGTVTKNPTSSPYPQGVTVTITATASNGWYFANWSGDTNGTVNPLQVTMNSSMVITGNFLAYPTYMLTLATNGQGAIGLNPAGGSYVSNTVVTATATAATGWVFTVWSGCTNSSANPVSLTLNTNLSLTGAFAQLPTFDVQPVSVTNSVTNIAGSTVSFSAHAVGNAPLGYQWFFSGGSLPGATNTTLTLTNVSWGSAGNYWIVATNSYGSGTSHVASLTLTNASGSTNVVYSPDEASLRAAIKIGGWVSLAFNGTVTITNTINITNNVILDGKNVTAVISGGNAVRVFYVAPGVTFCATNLTLANGSCIVTNGTQGTNADAGAIYNNGGTVTLVSCTLTNNSAQSLIWGGMARGGAIFNNAGTVSLFQSALTNNSAIGGGPNCAVDEYTTGIGLGGAIYNTNGSVTIVGCNVSGNLCEGICESDGLGAYPGSGLTMGGAAYQASGSLTISNSSFALNQALGGGGTRAPASPTYGGAVAANGGSITIDHSQLFANIAQGGGAGYHASAASGFGGAVYSAVTLNVKDSSFFGNQTFAGNGTMNVVDPSIGSRGVDGFGGAIYNSGTAMLDRCSVYSNYVQGGGAVAYMGGIVGNGGTGWGGGIFNASQFTATNCTIALNSAVGGYCCCSSSTRGNAMGGGVFNNTNATFTGMNLTIASNSCSSPSGPYLSGIVAGIQIANTNGTLRLHNSLIAYGGTNGNAYGVITDDGYNISSDGSANLNSGSSYSFTDPKLGPLADYGGPTWCMVLLPDSPAIDGGDTAAFPATDQRGRSRPYGAAADIGAFESSAPFIVEGKISGSTDVVIFSAGTTNVAVTNAGTYWFRTLPAGGCVITPSNASYVFVPNTRSFTLGPDQLNADFKAYHWNTINIDSTTNSTLHLVYAGANGQTYRMLTASNLTGLWLPVATNALSASNYFDLFLPMPGGLLHLYRAVNP